MTGTLKQGNEGWEVFWYEYDSANSMYPLSKSLPLDLSDATPTAPALYWEGKLVEFEIALSPTEGPFNNPKHYARLSKPKPSTAWDTIFTEYATSNYGMNRERIDVWKWLKQNYQSPTKIES